jgi:hypothetical protein
MPKLVKFRDTSSELRFCEFTSWSFATTPIEEFGMPFYGLPDLVSKSKPSQSTWYWWLIGFAVFLAILALLVRWGVSFFKKK